MAAKDFKVVISGQDNLTSTLKKIEAAFRNMFEPVERTGKRIKDASDTTPIESFRKSMSSATMAAKDLALGIGSIIPPIGELAALATAGGITALGMKWADFSRQLSLTSALTGENTSKLYELTAAARAAGVDTKTSLGAAQSFQESIQNAIYGRNKQFRYLMAQLHVDIGTWGDPRKALDVIPKIADYMKTRTPSEKDVILQFTGLGSLAPLMLDYNKYNKIGQDLAPAKSDEDIAAGNNFKDTINQTYLEMDNLFAEIGVKTTPALNEAFTNLNTVLKENTTLITNVAGVFADAIAGIFHPIQTLISFSNGVDTAKDELWARWWNGYKSDDEIKGEFNKNRFEKILPTNAPSGGSSSVPISDNLSSLFKNAATSDTAPDGGPQKAIVNINIATDAPKGTRVVTSATGNVNVISKTNGALPSNISSY